MFLIFWNITASLYEKTEQLFVHFLKKADAYVQFFLDEGLTTKKEADVQDIWTFGMGKRIS